jgi:hypothetical protein
VRFLRGKHGSLTPEWHCRLKHKKGVQKRLCSRAESTIKVKEEELANLFFLALILVVAAISNKSVLRETEFFAVRIGGLY